MSTETILPVIFGIVLTALIGYLSNRLKDRAKTEDDTLASVVKDVNQLKAVAVSESRVREIIKDAIEPTGSDVKEIKSNIHELARTLQGIEIKLATEMAYKRGRQEKEDVR